MCAKKALAHGGPLIIRTMHAGPYEYQIIRSRTVKVTCHPHSSSVACAHIGRMVGFRLIFSPIFSFSYPRNLRCPSKKQLYTLICISINFYLYFFIAICFAFDVFLNLDFFQFYPREFYFI